MLKTFSFKQGIAKRLVGYLFVFSFFLTLITSGTQIYFDYSRNLTSIEQSLDQIEKSHVKTMVNSLWVSNISMVQIQMEGILQLPHMQFVEVIAEDSIRISVGERHLHDTIQRTYPLSYLYRGKSIDLGQLLVVVSLDEIYENLFEKAVIIVITQSIRAIIIVFLFYVIFYFVVGRHLAQMSTYTKELELEKLDVPLVLHRFRKEVKGDDEISALESSINAMRIYLDRYIQLKNKTAAALQDLNLKLEEKVDKRTERLRFVNQELEKQNKDIEELNLHLEASNATKDRFFAIIAHDLKGPLTALSSLLEYMLKNYEGYDKNRLKEGMEAMHESAKHISNLLLNLLEWARSQTKQLNFKPNEQSIHQIILGTVFLLKESAKAKEITLTTLSKETDRAFIDENMMTTVIRNLISNAIKFTHPNGTITIETETDLESNQMHISVKDSGVGMSDEELNKLFRIDVQYSNLGTAKERGTGLGLILCKEFIEKHQGTIRVESERAKGSTFIVTVPKHPKAISFR